MPENSSKPKVLVADDERVIADTLAMILNQSGFEARAVYSGEKALELAATFVPDMLISDVIMADLNGIDAAIQLRASPKPAASAKTASTSSSMNTSQGATSAYSANPESTFSTSTWISTSSPNNP